MGRGKPTKIILRGRRRLRVFHTAARNNKNNSTGSLAPYGRACMMLNRRNAPQTPTESYEVVCWAEKETAGVSSEGMERGTAPMRCGEVRQREGRKIQI
ncbi:hypothetical protein ZHAS_00020990 [Anopheles sinensis]|uniref:Uncharacterized protein n=1 Tax=Anopheles sinensis TaxID=74873 RepID=A0A084WR79_ANOSI|nr:hypothetical protein ZHAS_00020990 [Anopheles sinensis]